MRKPGCPAGEARPRRTSARCARRSSTAAAEILRRFQPRLQELSEELEAELAPLRERLSDASQGTQYALDTLEPDLPELPEPETSPEEDGWLFDSRRDYLEQIHHYKAR
jgi:hypothetical protein